MAETAGREAFEEVLCAYAPPDREGLAKEFLSGLSIDELGFMTEFFQSSFLATSGKDGETWSGTGAFRGTEDRDHKRMMLDEFAACCGFLVKLRE